MAGFRKPKPEQAALKIGIYGPAGAGKTLTSLLIAEGLAKKAGKRIAFVDTERGTDFYCQSVKERKVHPEAFDFDALYSKSIFEVTNAINTLDPKEYNVIVIDSITHIWEACIAAYSGRQTKAGTIPMHAWGKIKKPYKDLMSYLLSSPMHVLLCGRQGAEYTNDEDSGELKQVGLKMKAEGETPYEPHILIRLSSSPGKDSDDVLAHIEKDRSGILAGRTFVNPTFDSIAAPLLHLLGDKQAEIKSTDEQGAEDAEAIEEAEIKKEKESAAILREYKAKIDLAKEQHDLDKIGKEITSDLKKKMLASDVSELRASFVKRYESFGGK